MKLNDLEWPFCVKVCLWIGMSLVCVFWLLDKTVWKLSYAYTVSNITIIPQRHWWTDRQTTCHDNAGYGYAYIVSR